MRSLRIVMIALTGFIFLFACSSKKSEAEYYQAATEAYSNKEYKTSIEQFKNIVNQYPQGKRTAEAYFMLGFINANDLKNFEEAEKYYKTFIDKYPDHDLTDDAEFELKTLGKDENELPFFHELASDSLND